MLGRGLVEIAALEQFRALRAGISHFEDPFGADLALDSKAPVLRVGGAKVSLERQRGGGQRHGEVLGERVVQTERKLFEREMKPEIKVRRVEVETLTASQRGLVVVHPVAGSQHGSQPPRTPGEADSRAQLLRSASFRPAGSRSAPTPASARLAGSYTLARSPRVDRGRGVLVPQAHGESADPDENAKCPGQRNASCMSAGAGDYPDVRLPLVKGSPVTSRPAHFP